MSDSWFISAMKGLARFLWKRLTMPEGMTGVYMELGSGYSRQAEEDRIRLEIVRYCRSQIGKPYKLGMEVPLGDDPSEIDCSELVEHAYFAGGKHIPDGSPYQFDFCRAVLSPVHADLGFLWSDKWQRIGHVFVFTGSGTVVHAMAGRGVVEDPVDQWQGHPRFRGWRRHPDFIFNPGDRPVGPTI